jgi:hypothetical protein
VHEIITVPDKPNSTGRLSSQASQKAQTNPAPKKSRALVGNFPRRLIFYRVDNCGERGWFI